MTNDPDYEVKSVVPIIRSAAGEGRWFFLYTQTLIIHIDYDNFVLIGISSHSGPNNIYTRTTLYVHFMV